MQFVYLAQICLTLPKGSIGSLFLFQKLFYFIEMVGKFLNTVHLRLPNSVISMTSDCAIIILVLTHGGMALTVACKNVRFLQCHS